MPGLFTTGIFAMILRLGYKDLSAKGIKINGQFFDFETQRLKRIQVLCGQPAPVCKQERFSEYYAH